MSILDKVAAAIPPPESEEARRAERKSARAAAEASDWLAQIIEHHEAIEAAFARVKAAHESIARRAAQQELATLVSAHANAEEAVIYPALIYFGHVSVGSKSYTEQAGAKASLAELEYLDPMSTEYEDKLEQIRKAIAHHSFEEENRRFLVLKQLNGTEQEHLTRRYAQEFQRFLGPLDRR